MANLRRIKRITSHVGVSRYMAELAFTGSTIPRQRDIPSPYAYSTKHLVYRNEFKELVIVVETAHKQYDVFLVPRDAELTVGLED